MGLCVWWGLDRHLLGFDLILISVMEHIRYMMTSSTDVRIMFAVISSYDNNLENRCTESSVTVHIMIY